jgi:hypothetical protein
MKGQFFTLESSGKTTQLQIIASSINAPEYDLNMVLVPDQYVAGSLETNVYLFVTGTFKLNLQKQEVMSGSVAGWMDAGRNGVLKLTDEDNYISLDMSVVFSEKGDIYANVAGWFPVVMENQTESGQSADNTHIFWYLSRTTGLVAYLLLFINLFLGFGLKVKFLDRIFQRWRTYDLHQFSALLAFALILLHVLVLLGDSYFKFNLVQLLVPFQSPYRTVWVTSGIIGFYLIIIVTFSCYIRRRIGQKIWRILHYLSFILFWIILIHGIKTGTDTSAFWVQIMYISSGTLIAFLLLWRLFAGSPGKPARKAIQTERGGLIES